MNFWKIVNKLKKLTPVTLIMLLLKLGAMSDESNSTYKLILSYLFLLSWYDINRFRFQNTDRNYGMLRHSLATLEGEQKFLDLIWGKNETLGWQSKLKTLNYKSFTLVAKHRIHKTKSYKYPIYNEKKIKNKIKN